jgi:hypothetical protein
MARPIGSVVATVVLVAVLGSAATVLLLFRHTLGRPDDVNKQQTTVVDGLLHGGFVSYHPPRDPSSFVCSDPVWCSVPMPTRSYFRFDAPNDPYRWRVAQSQAASGEQVLLKGTRAVFTNHMDFLDGDARFRRYQELTDIFLDHNSNLSELTMKEKGPETKFLVPNNKKLRRIYDWNAWGHRDPVVPPTYDFRAAQRAPVIQVGYNAFGIVNHTAFFEGGHLGEAHVDLHELSQQWDKVKDRIIHPFILLHAGNENWGLLSTQFPNRTTDWGRCCEHQRVVQAILNHPKTVAVFTNQHHNLTHPKLLSLPRGIPLYIPNRKKLLYDLLRVYESTLRKESLLFASSSNWKHRPYISACIARKFAAADQAEFSAYDTGDLYVKGRMTEVDYYRKLASARMVLTLPGLGYDCFR